MGFINSKTIQYAANAKQVYVDVANGSDVAEHGRGGVLQPYATIPAALAAIALAGPGNYGLILAPGDYAGAPIAWPGNVGVKGNGAGVSISHDINYTSGAGTEVVVFEDVSLGNFTADLTLGGISLLYILNGSLSSFTRVDATVGAKFVQIINMNIGAFDIAGSVLCYNCSMLSGGPYVVQDGGNLSFQSSLIPAPVTLNGTAVMALNGCTTFAGGSIFTGVGGGTVVTDSSSLFGGATVAGTAVFVFSDDASREAFTPAVPANWLVAPSKVDSALDELAARASAAEARTEFVFQPGGADGGNTYTSWAALYAAMAANAGPKTVYFDDTFVSPAVIPAGAYALDEVTFDAAIRGKITSVQVADGVSWTNLRVIKNLAMDFQNSAYVEAISGIGIFLEGTTITANGTSAVWHMTGSCQFQLAQSSSLSGPGAARVVDIDDTFTFQTVQLTSSDIANNALGVGGSAAAVYLAIMDPTITFHTQTFLTATETQVRIYQASGTAYTPAVAANYPSPTPDDVAEALDALANQQSVVGSVSAPQAAAKQIDLGALVNHASVIFLIQGLSTPVRTFDYTLVDGVTTVINWTGLGLDGVIVGGENYSVQFRN